MTHRPALAPLTRRRVLAGGIAALACAPILRPGAAWAAAVEDAAFAGPLGDVWVGSAQAGISVIEYAALTCGHCAAFHRDVWPGLKARWVDPGRARFALRGYSLNPLDTAGFMLARADGGARYYAITDLLFERQADWAFVAQPLDALRALARQAGFTEATFDATLRDPALYQGVSLVQARAEADLGVRATPTLFVGGQRLKGPASAAALDGAIEAALRARGG